MGYIGDRQGTTIEVIKGDTRSLEYGSYKSLSSLPFPGRNSKPLRVLKRKPSRGALHPEARGLQ